MDCFPSFVIWRKQANISTKKACLPLIDPIGWPGKPLPQQQSCRLIFFAIVNVARYDGRMAKNKALAMYRQEFESTLLS
jgi:hypothetical protein